jgi:predicted dehydrogenase
LSLKLGVIGSGSIIPFHLDAAKAVGFEIAIIGSRPGSEKTAALAERYGAVAGADWQAVLAAEVDALLIGPETAATPAILAAALETGLPILSEKPGAYASSELKSLAGHANASKILVGYNRRHYSSTASAKQLVDAAGMATFTASIPEASWTTGMASAKKREILLSNTVHVLDLLRYLFGDLTIGSVAKLDAADAEGVTGVLSRAAVLSAGNHSGTAIVTFGSPSNYFVDIHTNGRSAALRPIEFYNEFDGVKVIEPTEAIPLRHYVANSAGKFEISRDDLDFKPGFVGQMRELKTLATGGDSSGFKSASLADAIAVLELAEGLL